mmetsp:Transcript_64236/g.94048  ORF Transcript_64236/g.94048 Transcript_64236/m.94048 type:complete len:105 (-) Transcript_64236:768-1082(-)
MDLSQSLSLAAGSCTVIDGAHMQTGMHTYQYYDTCPFDFSQLPKCDVNQYHIVPGKHDLKPPAPDGSCGTIAGLKVPLPSMDPVFDHSNYVSASHTSDSDWLPT